MSDTGACANVRFDSTANNGIPIEPSSIIRLFADYNKVLRVNRSMIRIEIIYNGVKERNWYTIHDEALIYKLNTKDVRVRLRKSAPDHIYLFDIKTDTYLGFLRKNMEVAGDVANMTDQDKKLINEHKSMLRSLRKKRQKEFEDLIESVESDRINQLNCTLPNHLNNAALLPSLEERASKKVVINEQDTSGKDEHESSEDFQAEHQTAMNLEVLETIQTTFEEQFT